MFIRFKEAYGPSLIYKCSKNDMIQTPMLRLNTDEIQKQYVRVPKYV